MAARGAGKKLARSLERNSEKRAPPAGAERRPHPQDQKNSVRDRDGIAPHRLKDRKVHGGGPRKSTRRSDLAFSNGDRLIDMTGLKLAVRVLPTASAARLLIMDEPDQMLMSEYCVKVGIWFKLLKKPMD